MTFTANIHQNEYLSEGAQEVHAVITVTAPDDLPSGGAAERCIALVIDTSGSMSNPMSKIIAARKATVAAVIAIPDGTRFCVISGDNTAQLVYPSRGRDMAVADAATRAEAAKAANDLQPSGGTAISTWLDLAREMFEGYDDAIKAAYLITDGKNESEPPSKLQTAIAKSVGAFQCDARGVGAAWVVDELRAITSSLMGELDIVKDADAMEDDFVAFLDRALGKTVRDVSLKVWNPKGATVNHLKQVSPSIEDITSASRDSGPLARSWSTGSWAPGESRDYHLSVKVPAGDVGQEKLAARVTLVIDGDDASQGLVRAVWTEDHALTTRIDPQVAHYTGQADLAKAIQEGLAARRAGDHADATIKLGKAVKLAHESGNAGTIRMLAKVVEVEDPATGTVRLKAKVEQLDEMELDTRSTRTVRVTNTGGA